MRNLAIVLGMLVAVGAAGCSDSDEGKTGENPTVFPNGKAYKVTTTIDPTTIKAGGSTTVTCLVVDTAERPFDTPTQVTVTPDTGITIDGTTVTAAASGTYKVVCTAPDVDVLDEVGADLTVEAGEPAKVLTIIEPSTVAAGEKATVTCNVLDADNGIISGVETTIDAPTEVTVDGSEISAETAGTYIIACQVPGSPDLPGTPSTLTVTAGTATSVTLLVDPEKATYARGDTVLFTWVAQDQYGNELTDEPGTLSSPSSGVEVVGDVADNRFSFVDMGVYDWTVTLDNAAGVSDTLSLTCDDEGPQITITYPPRGATLTGADGDTITVTGTVTENMGTVDAIVVNGVAPAVDDEGNFTADITPEWGTNFIEIYANDSNGNEGKLTPSFQFTSEYVSFVETNAQGVKVADGAQALLGQGALDDGVHDPTDIDDIATLLEVVLENLDIPSLLEGQNGAVVTEVFPIFDVDVAGLIALTGDVTLEVRIVPPTDIGPSSVTLDSTTGGINTLITMGTPTEQGLQLNLEIDVSLDADATAAGFTLGTATGSATVPNQVQAQTLTIQAKLLLDKPAGGTLTSGVENFNLSFSALNLDVLQDVVFNFSFDVPFVGSTDFSVSLSDLGFNLQDLTDALIDPLIDTLGGILTDFLEPTLEGFITDALQGLLEQFELNFDFELPDFLGTGKPPVNVNVYTELSSALFLEQGGQVGLSLGAYAPKGDSNTHEPDGAIKRSGCLVGDTEQLAYDWSHELGVGFQTDALNMVFFSLWWSGFVHGPIDLSSLLGDSSPIPIDNLVLNLDPYAAPVINDCSKAAGVQLELGDLRAEISGDLLGFGIDATVFLDLKLLVNFVGSPEGLLIEMDSIQFFDVEVVAVGPDVSEKDNRELLENQLEPLLSSFLVGETFGPIEIPSLDFDGLIPGLTLPPGTDTTLDLGPLEISKETGYVLVETDLD